ncbi:MAG TPA: hypothetical protein VHL34_17595 [Rhizomicrobium sp.]|jgi:hypothetical protein|nr:hypothetical protein [Rhizomicrobium sp.]
MEFVNSLWAAIQAVILHADWITLGIIAIIAIAAGFLMESISSIITGTVIALIAFGIAGYVREVAMNGANAAAYAGTTLHNFQVLQMLTVLAYAIVFAIAIGVVNVVRSMVLR